MRKIQEKRSQNRNGGALDARGFTLAELLIVVAIIGVLVAISIPIFSSQLEKAREATDAANIRSQYAQVMAEAIFDGGDVNGRDLYGAIELKQKQDEWQNTGLKSNLEGGYGQIIGDYPKAGGTAWVEYKYNDGIAVLHYEGGSGSGGTSGGDSGSGSGSGSEQPSGSSGSGSGGAGGGTVSPGGGSGSGSGSGSELPGGDSGSGSGEAGSGIGGGSTGVTVAEQISSQSTVLPENISGTSQFQVEQGKIYSYQGKYYVALTNCVLSQYVKHYPETPNGSYLYVQVTQDAEVLNSSNLVQKSDGTYELRGLKAGQLYETEDGSVYIRKGDYSPIGVAPTGNDGNWQLIAGLKIN